MQSPIWNGQNRHSHHLRTYATHHSLSSISLIAAPQRISGTTSSLLSSIGISPLPSTHLLIFPHPLVRTSTWFYQSFIHITAHQTPAWDDSVSIAVQVGKAWLILSKMYRAATNIPDGVAKAESALMRAWEILRSNQATPMPPLPPIPRPVSLVTLAFLPPMLITKISVYKG